MGHTMLKRNGRSGREPYQIKRLNVQGGGQKTRVVMLSQISGKTIIGEVQNPEICFFEKEPQRTLYRFLVFDAIQKALKYLLVGEHALMQYRRYLCDKEDKYDKSEFVCVTLTKEYPRYVRSAHRADVRFARTEMSFGGQLSEEHKAEVKAAYQKHADIIRLNEETKISLGMPPGGKIKLMGDPLEPQQHYVPIGSCVTEAGMESAAAAYDQMEQDDRVSGSCPDPEPPKESIAWDSVPEGPMRLERINRLSEERVLELLWDIQYQKGDARNKDRLLARFRELSGKFYPKFMA